MKTLLNQFPSVLSAFQMIEADNSGTLARKFKPRAEVPEHLLRAFKAVERVLTQASKMAVGSCCPEVLTARYYEGAFTRSDTLFTMIVSGCNDSAPWAMQIMKCGDAEIFVTEWLLNEFFDGSLSETFTELRKRLKGA